jgi:hypothetical protein
MTARPNIVRKGQAGESGNGGQFAGHPRSDAECAMTIKDERRENLGLIFDVWGSHGVPESVNEAIWDLSDGYGEPGYIPEQGYDWSGIRDSTPEAISAMAEVARDWLESD